MATFLLIPGAGGQAWFWHRVAPLLEAAGHRAIAVELPTADATAGFAAYTDVAVAAAAGHDDPVVVGQSMGAMTAPLVCLHRAVRLLVLLNPMIPAPGESAGEWWARTGQGDAAAAKARADGRDPDADFDLVEMFFHDVPEPVVAEAMQLGAPRQSDRPFGEPWPMQAWPEVPTEVISAADDRFFPLDFQQRLARTRLGVEPDVTPGGHLAALSRPTELAARLLSYLDS